MSSIQLSDARTKLGLVLKDISDISDSQFLYMCQTVSDYIYREIVKTDPERFIKATTINVTAGTNEYTMPTDFFHIKVLNTGLFIPDNNGVATDTRWLLTGYGSANKGYYLNNTKLVLTPDAYPNTETAVLRYIPNPPLFTASSDYFTNDKLSTGNVIIDSQYENLLVNALMSQYMIIDEDTASESVSDFRFARSLQDLLANINRTTSSYTTPNIADIY
jgi:hypothetical protein